MAIGDPKPTEQVNRLGKRGFSTFNAQKTEGICAYCLNPFQRGQWTAWAPGIVKGHAHCIEAAWQASRLIIGPSAAHNRPGCMLAHCRPADESWEALKAVGAIIGPMECLVDQRLDRECFGRYNIVAARCDGCDSRLRCRHFAAELATVNSGSGRWGRMEHTFGEIKKLAKEHNLAIITAKQPRKHGAMKPGLEELYSPAGSRPVMECFGRHMLKGEECRTCGYRKNCAKEALDERHRIVENCLEGHGDLDCENCKVDEHCCFGRAWESPDETCDNCLITEDCKQVWEMNQDVPPEKSFNEWRKPHCNSAGLQCNGNPGEGDVCSAPGCYYDGHNSKEERTPQQIAYAQMYGGQPYPATMAACAKPDEEESLEGQTIITKGPIDGIPSCEHFVPERIAVLVMHERSRPNQEMGEREMGVENYRQALERQWDAMAAKALADWKRENGRNLPICPVHKFLTTYVKKVKNRRFLRELYLVCAKKETGGF